MFFPAGRVAKRPKREDAGGLQQAAIQLLEQQQNICALLREVGVSERPSVPPAPPTGLHKRHDS